MEMFKMIEPKEVTIKKNPRWMKNPIYVEEVVPAELPKYCRDLLLKTQFQALLPVQNAIMQHGLENDVYLHTLTGSGKTLAYVLLILHLLKDRKIPLLRVVIVVPSKDLVYQVFKLLELFNLNIVTAGKSDIQKELLSLSNADVFITTPNRLLQQIENGLSLENLYSFIVDEADRLFGWDWLDGVLPKLPRYSYEHIRFRLGLCAAKPLKKHKFRLVLVSATLPSHKLLAIDPVYITNKTGTTYNLPQMYHFVIETNPMDKPLHLLSYLMENKNQQTLIFTNSVESSIRLTSLLKIIIAQQKVKLDADKITYVNGDLSDIQRKQIYAKFEQKIYGTLICSDLVARGIDLPVEIVIQYSCATNIRQFVHRCGRTSRGLHKGKSLLLIEEDQLENVKYLKKIIPGDNWRNTGCKLLHFDTIEKKAMIDALETLKTRNPIVQ
eukprot:NODE_545_length_6876_cov_0.237013.p2 type:complete len:439 gc:universal NODE_545_length_6876_cov_0.237013:3613-2297(-)